MVSCWWCCLGRPQNRCSPADGAASWFSAKWVALSLGLLPVPPYPFQCDEKKLSKTVSKTDPFLPKTCEERSTLSVQKHDCDKYLTDAT